MTQDLQEEAALVVAEAVRRLTAFIGEARTALALCFAARDSRGDVPRFAIVAWDLADQADRVAKARRVKGDEVGDPASPEA